MHKLLRDAMRGDWKRKKSAQQNGNNRDETDKNKVPGNRRDKNDNDGHEGQYRFHDSLAFATIATLTANFARSIPYSVSISRTSATPSLLVSVGPTIRSAYGIPK